MEGDGRVVPKRILVKVAIEHCHCACAALQPCAPNLQKEKTCLKTCTPPQDVVIMLSRRWTALARKSNLVCAQLQALAAGHFTILTC